MSDILSEPPVAIADIPKHVPARPHQATIWRWHVKGVCGVKLETYLCGGKRFTSVPALRRFQRAVTEARDGSPIDRAPSRQRRQEIAQAEAELDAAGI